MTSMKTMIALLVTILFGLLFISQSSHAEIYKLVDEYTINAFIMRYAEVQHDEYESGSYTKVVRRKGDPIPEIAERCRYILERCPGFNESEFRDLVSRYATYWTTQYAPGSRTTVIHERGEIIPGEIPSLLSSYCGQGIAIPKGKAVPAQEPSGREYMYETNYGYRNAITGEKWQRVHDRLVNSETGESMHETNYGYYNPRTGERWHKSHDRIFKSTGD